VATVLDMHFHCPDCEPQLRPGVTRGICGQTIPVPAVGSGPVRKCPPCKTALPGHKASHTRR